MTDVSQEPNASPAEPGTQDRIAALIEQRRAAELQAQASRQQFENIRPVRAGDESQYADHSEWRQAVVAEAVTTAQRAAARSSAEMAAQRAFQARSQTFQARVDDFRANAPDFDQVARNPHLEITPAMADAITESNVGPQVSYWLGQNPDEAARIARLPPVRQIAEIGQLEARLGPAQGGRTGVAPSSPRATSSVTGVSSSAGYDPSQGTNADYRAWREAQKPRTGERYVGRSDSIG